MTLQTFKTTKSHITNSSLLSYGEDEWFPIRMYGEWVNKDEFIHRKMKQFNLKTPILVRRALSTIGE